MAIEGRHIEDPERGFVHALSETENGYEGEKNYLVNTDILELALDADRVPKMGDPWSTARGDCQVRRKSFHRIGGRDENGQGSGGTSRVQVLYASPGSGGTFTAGLNGKSWTEIRFGSETTTVKYPWFRTKFTSLDAPSGVLVNEPFTQIAGGDGAAVEVGTIEAIVHAYVKPADVGPLLTRIAKLLRPSRLNRETIVLPRLQNTLAQWTIDEEQARMRSAEVRTPVAGKVEVVMNLALAEDWRTHWQPENSEGRGTPNVFYKDNVYRPGDFSNLW